MSKVWQCLEDIHGLVAVPVTWRSRLGGYFDVFKRAFLRSRPARAKSFPCPDGCGCAHEVIEHKDGSLVGVCRCEPWNCEDVRLSSEDVALLELNWQKLGRGIAKGFGCDSKEGDFGLPHTMQVASFSGAALPVVLTIQNGRDGFRSVAGQLIGRLRERFVLLAPTGRFYDAHTHGLLKGANAGFFDLESQMTLLPTGALRAYKSAGELFSPFIEDAKEPMNDEEARRLFALLKALESEGNYRKAPVTRVFRLYVIEERSRDNVARQCNCVPSLVTLRLKQIETKLGRKPAELRQLSGHFQKIEESVSDPRARRIRRQSSLYDDRFTEAEE